jgi:uncharacterized protein YlxP (DUF503 family)
MPPKTTTTSETMFVLAYEVEVRLAHAESLKDKRRTITSIIEGARRRFAVSSAEIGHQDHRSSAVLGFAVVASAEGVARAVIDDVDRFVWSFPEIEVVHSDRRWLE